MKPFDLFSLSAKYVRTTGAAVRRRRDVIVSRLNESYLLPPDAELACQGELAELGINADPTLIRHDANLYRQAFLCLSGTEKISSDQFRRAMRENEPLIWLLEEGLTWPLILTRRCEELERRLGERAEQVGLASALERLAKARERILQLESALRRAEEKNTNRELSTDQPPAPSEESDSVPSNMPRVSIFYGERRITYGPKFLFAFHRLDKAEQEQVAKAVRLLSKLGHEVSGLVCRRYKRQVAEIIPKGANTARANQELRIVWSLNDDDEGNPRLLFHNIFRRGDGQLRFRER
ncbi:MAG: hypothetical protein HW383_16 [Candidatus Magasanikbacteria bacterium]|nr:hypothetical protein [Candidatus Magasanikbacteria bacterium]